MPNYQCGMKFIMKIILEHVRTQKNAKTSPKSAGNKTHLNSHFFRDKPNLISCPLTFKSDLTYFLRN